MMEHILRRQVRSGCLEMSASALVALVFVVATPYAMLAQSIQQLPPVVKSLPRVYDSTSDIDDFRDKNRNMLVTSQSELSVGIDSTPGIVPRIVPTPLAAPDQSEIDISSRQWEPSVSYLAKPALFHWPTYFENVSLERSAKVHHPFLEPVISTGKFIGHAAILPGSLVVHPPWRRIYSDSQGPVSSHVSSTPDYDGIYWPADSYSRQAGVIVDVIVPREEDSDSESLNPTPFQMKQNLSSADADDEARAWLGVWR